MSYRIISASIEIGKVLMVKPSPIRNNFQHRLLSPRPVKPARLAQKICREINFGDTDVLAISVASAEGIIRFTVRASSICYGNRNARSPIDRSVDCCKNFARWRNSLRAAIMLAARNAIVYTEIKMREHVCTVCTVHRSKPSIGRFSGTRVTAKRGSKAAYKLLLLLSIELRMTHDTRHIEITHSVLP